MGNPTPLLLLLLLANAVPSSAIGHHHLFPKILKPIVGIISNLQPHDPIDALPLPAPLPQLAPVQPLPQLAPVQPPMPTQGLVSFTGGKGYYRHMAREFLQAHNVVRAKVGEAPVKWSRVLARYAQLWSESRRSECTIIHSTGTYGENMFWGSGWSWKASDAVASWAAEIDDYDVPNNSCVQGMMCGHFTQMVWNDTRRIGCGRAECYGGGVIITCSYDPPGNFLGERPFLLNLS